MEVLVGIVEDIIYQNENNGYTILGVSTDQGEKTCVGTMFHISIGEEIRMEGNYTTHPIYGAQFSVEQFTTTIPRDKNAFEKYLGSGAIKGIGPVMAAKIVETFQEDTFRIIEEEPERLAQIKGISESKARAVAEVFYEQRSLRQAIIFLQEYQISLTYAVKIYDYYKDRVYQVIRENPYRLAEEINGIGFKLADQIARRSGIAADAPERLMAGIIYVLNQGVADGHVYLAKEEVTSRTRELLQIDLQYIDVELTELVLKQSITIKEGEGGDIVYLTGYYKMEEYCAHKLLRLVESEVAKIHDLDRKIKIFEQTNKLVLDEIQREAVKLGTAHPVFVLTGGPGTGKTTSINALISMYEDEGLSIALAAPTGRAAKRMTETTGHEAKTIHRLLEINFSTGENQSFERNEDYPLECDVLIVDETSMLDLQLLFHVLKAMPLGGRIVFVGDKDQLPSVGAGNVLHDLLKSKDYIPRIVLEKIYRQAEKSAIVLNAHRIHLGEMIDYKNKDDFFFIRRTNSQQIVEEIISLVKTRLPKYLKSSEGIQILSPMRKGVLGVDQLNQELQKALNPSGPKKGEKVFRHMVFREGDKVMQIKNNYSIPWKIMSRQKVLIDEGMGIFNGDLGTITDINHFAETVKVEFDDLKSVAYEFNQLEELELAYAITIHKSQGSEYPVVVMPLFRGPAMLLSRNLLYTGVTRAKHMVVLVGDEDVLAQMIANNKELTRNSSLDLRMKEAAEVLGVNDEMVT